MNPGPRLSSAHETGKEVPIFQILPVNVPFQQNRVHSGSLAKNRGRCFDSWGATVSQSRGGFTLVEMSVTIAIILVLVGGASLGIQPYLAYRDGRTSGEMLSAVKAAQLMYLSDYPSTPVTSLTKALILPYMPNGTWPTLPLVNGVAPTINCAKFPPEAVLSGTTYDPSPAKDGLWDTGP